MHEGNVDAGGKIIPHKWACREGGREGGRNEDDDDGELFHEGIQR